MLGFVHGANLRTVRNRQDACSTKSDFDCGTLGTGKMPVPQRVILIVERASCPFLRRVQHISLTYSNSTAYSYLKFACQTQDTAFDRSQQHSARSVNNSPTNRNF